MGRLLFRCLKPYALLLLLLLRFERQTWVAG